MLGCSPSSGRRDGMVTRDTVGAETMVGLGIFSFSDDVRRILKADATRGAGMFSGAACQRCASVLPKLRGGLCRRRLGPVLYRCIVGDVASWCQLGDDVR